MARVFISYRRVDGRPVAKYLARKIREENPDWQVFLDAAIPAGAQWQKEIGRELIEADLVLVVISPSWVARNHGWAESPIESRDDWVRREVRFALANGKEIVPVLMDGAHMPSRDQLPPDIADLADRQAKALYVDPAELAGFDDSSPVDVHELISDMRQLLGNRDDGPHAAPSTATAAPSRPRPGNTTAEPVRPRHREPSPPARKRLPRWCLRLVLPAVGTAIVGGGAVGTVLASFPAGLTAAGAGAAGCLGTVALTDHLLARFSSARPLVAPVPLAQEEHS